MQKQTKKALVLSVLSLMLCVSMLVGTTFAWFTDSVTTGVNVIKSGNLDIELDYSKDMTTWADADGAKDVLDPNARWEPGHTEVVYLRITNAGNLALKYQFAMNIVDFVTGTSVLGNTINLADYLKYDIVDVTKKFDDRAAARAAVLEGKNLVGETVSGEMKNQGDTKTLALIVYMPETVGNEANYRGDTVPTIKLSFSLMATQLVHENDSFGNTYDEDAMYYNYVVTNEEELKAALASAKHGDVIGIKGNVTWTTGAAIGSTPFVPAASTFSLRAASTPVSQLTFVGIDEGATFTAIGDGVGPIGIDNGTVIFKNLKIADNSVSYAENNWEYGYLEFRGNTVFENCDIVNAIMMEGNSATFKNCTLNSNADNQYAVWVSDGTVSFEDCTVTGPRGLKVHEDYGSEVVSVSVNNCKFLGLTKKPGMAIGNIYMNGDTYTSGGSTHTNTTDTAISLTNNLFVGTQAGDQGNYKYETDTDVVKFSFVDKDNTVAGTCTAPGLYKDEDGVYYATTTSGLDKGISTATDGDTIVLSQDVVYTGNGYANITDNITLDLNGNDISTTSLGVVAKAGTIKNGTITNPVGSRAALRTWSGVSIENVTVVSPKNGGITVASGNSLPSIKNVTIEAQTYGIELQYGSSVGTIENVTITAGENGIVAQAATVGEIKNCTINGEKCGVWGQLKGVYDLSLDFTESTVIGGNYGIYLCDEGAIIVPDGVAKLSYDEATVFEGSVKAKEFAFGQSGKLFINGAKVGAFISTADELIAFAKAVNENGNNFSGLTVFLTNDIDLNNALWTPIGQTGATQFQGIFDGQGYTIKNLNVDSLAQTGSHYSSGLFGWLNNATVKNVNVDGATVKGNHNVGVIAGYLETSGCTVSGCNVTNATVVAKHANGDACGDKVGVIVGHAGNAGVKVENCTAADSTVTAGRDAGQIVGAALTANVTGCSATNVTVTAGGDCPEEANIKNAVIGRVLG